MVSITRWFYKINGVATSQHSTVADNPATSILTNSITQENFPQDNKKLIACIGW